MDVGASFDGIATFYQDGLLNVEVPTEINIALDNLIYIGTNPNPSLLLQIPRPWA